MTRVKKNIVRTISLAIPLVGILFGYMYVNNKSRAVSYKKGMLLEVYKNENTPKEEKDLILSDAIELLKHAHGEGDSSITGRLVSEDICNSIRNRSE